jgi:DNA polymerase III subunit epsilon
VTFLSRLFSSRRQLPPIEAQRLDRWRSLSKPDLRASFEASRYVVVDVETSGLNPTRDKLISIGAVTVDGGRIALDDTFEIILQQPTPSSHDNILIHGIGGTVQTSGTEPVRALLDFLEFVGNVPLVAFHAAFDETSIRRAIRKHIGVEFKHPWLDLAYLAPALYPKLAKRLRSLDDWTDQFKIGNFARHSALADAYSTAQLLLVLINASKQFVSAQSFADMAYQEKTQRALVRLNQ